MTTQIKLIVLAVIATVFVIMAWFIRHQEHTIQDLNTSLAQAQQSAQICSDNTQKLVKNEKDLKYLLEVAVEEAKKEADKNRVLSIKIRNYKPVVPVITETNKGQYSSGSPDSNEKTERDDYLATHEFFNQYFDQTKK